MERIKLTKFKIQNYRCVDDSGWINLDDIIALVGINESGKTALLSALHTLNPSDGKIDIDHIRDYPRDRVSKDRKKIREKTLVIGRFLITKEYLSNREIYKEFKIPDCEEFFLKLERRYDKILYFSFEPSISNTFDLNFLTEVLDSSRIGINRKALDEKFTQNIKETILTKLKAISEELKKFGTSLDLNNDELKQKISLFLDKWNKDLGNYFTLIEVHLKELLDNFEQILSKTKEESITARLYEKIKPDIPVFIYFEDYNVLEGQIDVNELVSATDHQLFLNVIKIQRTLFKHVGLDPKEIYNLGKVDQNRGKINEDEKRRLKERNILLTSASETMTKTLNEYFKEDKDYKVEYNIDNQFLQILISDKENSYGINLEERSKGFRWFFSFFLVFLVESQESLKNTILLLDEPGIHLHLRAQASLIDFFEKLKDTNQIIYTTHSPFLIDENNLERVRAIFKEGGVTKVTEDIIKIDEKSIFPLQAALSYTTSQVLYQGSNLLLVEGITDFHYLKAINIILSRLNRKVFEDIVIMPCQGASKVDFYAKFVFDLKNQPVVLLDSDKAGEIAYRKLVKTLFLENEENVLKIDQFTNKKNNETEDLIGRTILIKLLSKNNISSKNISLTQEYANKSFTDAILSFCHKFNIDLINNWKVHLSLIFKKHIQKCTKEELEIMFEESELNIYEELIERINNLFK